MNRSEALDATFTAPGRSHGGRAIFGSFGRRRGPAVTELTKPFFAQPGPRYLAATCGCWSEPGLITRRGVARNCDRGRLEGSRR